MSIFPPNSPRRRATNPLPSWHYERPTLNFKPRARIEAPFTKGEIDDFDWVRPPNPTSSSPVPISATPDNDTPPDSNVSTDGEESSFRWFSSGVLCEFFTLAPNLIVSLTWFQASPIPRMHTRNPFLRHVAAQSPAPVAPLSPAAIPLPVPTPDELFNLR